MQNFHRKLLSSVLSLQKLIAIDIQEHFVKIDHRLVDGIIEEIVDLARKVEIAACGILLEESGCDYGLKSGAWVAKCAVLLFGHMNRLILIAINYPLAIINYQGSLEKTIKAFGG